MHNLICQVFNISTGDVVLIMILFMLLIGFLLPCFDFTQSLMHQEQTNSSIENGLDNDRDYIINRPLSPRTRQTRDFVRKEFGNDMHDATRIHCYTRDCSYSLTESDEIHICDSYYDIYYEKLKSLTIIQEPNLDAEPLIFFNNPINLVDNFQSEETEKVIENIEENVNPFSYFLDYYTNDDHFNQNQSHDLSIEENVESNKIINNSFNNINQDLNKTRIEQSDQETNSAKDSNNREIITDKDEKPLEKEKKEKKEKSMNDNVNFVSTTFTSSIDNQNLNLNQQKSQISKSLNQETTCLNLSNTTPSFANLSNNDNETTGESLVKTMTGESSISTFSNPIPNADDSSNVSSKPLSSSSPDPDKAQTTEKLNHDSDLNFTCSYCHTDHYYDQPCEIDDKIFSNGSYVQLLPISGLKEEYQGEGEKHLPATLGLTIDEIKFMIIEKFRNHLSFNLEFTKCRNRYCNADLKEGEGDHICNSCYEHFIQKGNLKGMEQ